MMSWEEVQAAPALLLALADTTRGEDSCVCNKPVNSITTSADSSSDM